MSALDKLLNDYAWLRRGEPDANTKDRDRLVQRVLAERERTIAELLAALQPFAQFAEDCRRGEPLTPRHDDRVPLVLSSGAGKLEGHPTIGDCRRAAQLTARANTARGNGKKAKRAV